MAAKIDPRCPFMYTWNPYVLFDGDQASETDSSLGEASYGSSNGNEMLTPTVIVKTRVPTVKTARARVPQVVRTSQQRDKPSNLANVLVEHRGESLLRLLLAISSDEALAVAVTMLCESAIESLAILLAVDPGLMRTLCLAYRGNIVVHLLWLPGCPLAKEITSNLMAIVPDLMCDKIGSLALSRLYDQLPPDAPLRHALDAKFCYHLHDLAMSSFGSYLVGKMLRRLGTSQEVTARAIRRWKRMNQQLYHKISRSGRIYHKTNY
jgi:hypothetical protein